MQTILRSYDCASGWNAALPAEMDSDTSLVLVFGSLAGEALAGPVAELRASFPRSALLGCSSAGEMLGDRVQDGSLCVAIARFASTRLRQASAAVHGEQDSAAAGASLARALAAPDLRAVFLLSDGLNVNGSRLVGAMTEILPPQVIVTGGLAADGDRFQSTWVLDRQGVGPGCVSAVGFYGAAIHVSHGCDSGWRDFGPLRRITRAEGNVLYELDGRPALDLYRDYLGRLAEQLPGSALLFPLSIQAPDGGQALVRTVLAIDETKRSMTFAGDIPQGWKARLMRATEDGLIDGAHAAIGQARAAPACPHPGLVISVSCVGRRLVLGQRSEEEIEAIVDGPKPPPAHLGFYSYGEIAPSLRDCASDLHNQTMTITAIGETV